MSVEIRLSESAEQHIQEAAKWYAERSPQATERFISELGTCLEQIAAFPLSHAIAYRDLRRALLVHFPYKVFYRLDGEIAYVLAVIHHSRSENLVLGDA